MARLSLGPPSGQTFPTLFQAGKLLSALMINNPALPSPVIPGPNETITTHSLMETIKANLFIDVNSLLANIVLATKSPDGLIDWIELKPKFHGSIVKSKSKIAPTKEAIFQFLINLLNGRATCNAFFHEMKTAMAPKHANRERKKKSEVNLNANSAEAKKTPPDSNPAIATATSLTRTPTQVNHPPKLEVFPQLQVPVVNHKPETMKSRCPGIQNHPACEECHTRPAAGIKLNRYPKCTVHRFHRNRDTYIDGYTDYTCYCAEDYDQRHTPSTI
ncbi:hypothetical protein F4604DRAFT_1681543 [Suillus subluteus]|nr:hypothetical protein F4604DRAFT_1681543 [Suillus subluteus]